MLDVVRHLLFKSERNTNRDLDPDRICFWKLPQLLQPGFTEFHPLGWTQLQYNTAMRGKNTIGCRCQVAPENPPDVL